MVTISSTILIFIAELDNSLLLALVFEVNFTRQNWNFRDVLHWKEYDKKNLSLVREQLDIQKHTPGGVL